MKKLFSISVFIILFSLLCAHASAGVPQYVNYQGKLTDDAGGLIVNDTVSIRFRIYTDPTGGTTLWDDTYSSVVIVNGLFSVLLGSIPDSVFDGSIRYLGIKVESDNEATPRKPFASVGYAYRASEADTADYSRAGAADNDWTFRITDTADTTLMTGGAWGIARYGNILYGNEDSTHVNLGVASTTGASGQNYGYCTVGGGKGNTASYRYATVGGGALNTASGNLSTVGGGSSNTAYGTSSTVGGGETHSASGVCATIGGGYDNSASGNFATVPGGYENTAAGAYSFAAGRDVTAAGSNAFAFGYSFTTNTSNAVVFYHLFSETKVGIQTTSPGNILTVKQNSTTDPIADSWTTYSSREYKRDIHELTSEEYADALDKVLSVPVVRFHYKGNDTKEKIGIIAEEAPEQILAEGNDKAISMNEYMSLLHAALKAQQSELDVLRAKLEKLESGR